MNHCRHSAVVRALNLELDKFTGESDATFFVVECEFCGQRSRGDIDFPLFAAEDFRDCAWKLRLGERAPTISWQGFERIIERARRGYGDATLELVGNSGVGSVTIEPIGRWPSELEDIEFSKPGGVLFRQRLIDELARRGFNLPFQAAALRDRLRRVHDYAILQPRVYRMLDARTFVENPAYAQCEHFGEVHAINPLKQPPNLLYLQGEYRNKVEPLFRVRGFDGWVFLADDFRDALEQIKPSGLSLVNVGIWTK